MRHHRLRFTASLLVAWLVMFGDHRLAAAELWVAPNFTAIDYRSFLGPTQTDTGAAQRPGEWRTAFRDMEVFKFPVAAFATEPPTADITPATLGTAAALALDVKRHTMRLLLENGKKVALEVGGPYEFFCAVPGEVGEQAAQYDLQTLDRIHRPVRPGGIGLGGRVDYLVMDGPISRIIDGGRPNGCGFKTQAEAIRELLDYMRAIRARYPEIGFVWLINVPNWELYGDILPPDGPTGGLAWGFRTPAGAVVPIELSTLVDAVVGAANAAGLPLAAIHLDTPYDFSTPDRMPSLLRLAQHIRTLGIPLGIAFNITRGIHWDAAAPFSNLVNPRNYYAAPRPPDGTNRVFDVEFKTGAIYASYIWRDRLGGLPEHMVVQSFFKAPYQLLPETTPATFMNTARDLAMLVKAKPRTASCSLPPSTSDYFRLSGSNVHFRRTGTGSLCVIAEPTGDQALLDAALGQRVEVRSATFFRTCQEPDPQRRFCTAAAPAVALHDRGFTVFTSLTSDYGCKRLPSNFYRMVGNGEVFFSNGESAIVVLGPQSWRPPAAELLPLLNIPTNLCMRVDGALP